MSYNPQQPGYYQGGSYSGSYPPPQPFYNPSTVIQQPRQPPQPLPSYVPPQQQPQQTYSYAPQQISRIPQQPQQTYSYASQQVSQIPPQQQQPQTYSYAPQQISQNPQQPQQLFSSAPQQPYSYPQQQQSQVPQQSQQVYLYPPQQPPQPQPTFFPSQQQQSQVPQQSQQVYLYPPQQPPQPQPTFFPSQQQVPQPQPSYVPPQQSFLPRQYPQPSSSMTYSNSPPSSFLGQNYPNSFGGNTQSPFPTQRDSSPPSDTPPSPFAQKKINLSQEAQNDGRWTDRMFEYSANFNMNEMVNSNWDPKMWKKWYEKFSENDKKDNDSKGSKDAFMRSQVVELLFCYTERFIRDKHFITQRSDDGTIIEVRAPSSHYKLIEAYQLFYESRAIGDLSIHHLDDVEIKPKLSETKVHVINADTLSIASVFDNKSVLVVNVCNPMNLWKRIPETTKLHQEEAILTQTSLALALNGVRYPMPDFTSFYAKDVAMNRDGLEKGFGFFTSPKRVSILAMPDILQVKQKDTYEYSLVQFRAKFEMILRICVLLGKTVLVVPAFGYKSLKEIDDTIAVINSVLKEFAGCVASVFFAISDRYYPEDVVCKYAKGLLLSKKSMKIEDVKKDNRSSIPLVLKGDQSKGVNFVRSGKGPCMFAGRCTRPELSHFNEFWHPPMCPDPKCEDKSDVHNAMYMHKVTCKYSNDCKHYIEVVVLTIQGKPLNDDLAYHNFRFSHKTYCPSWNECKETNPDHFKEFLHPPTCPNGIECPQLFDPEHKFRFRHNVRQCEKGGSCPFFANSEHTQQFAHPFLPFCPMAPYYCDDKSPKHFEEFSHICPNGPACNERDNPDHARKYIHVGKVCPNGASCDDLSEEHLGTYYHGFSGCSALSARKRCSNPDCTDRNPKHLRDQRHYWEGNMIAMMLLNVLDPDPGKHDPMWAPVCENGHRWNRIMDGYIAGRLNTASANFKDIVGWFRSMRPNHMCSVQVFLSILNLGCYASLELLRNFWAKPKDLLEAVLTCPYMEILREKYATVIVNNSETDIRKYAKKMIREKQGEVSRAKIGSASGGLIQMFNQTPIITDDKKRANVEFRTGIENKYSGIKPFLDELDELIVKILNSVIDLIKNQPGCKNDTNNLMRTNYTPWTIVGPHYDSYGGGQVVMVLKKEVMNHPDYFMCPVYTNSYCSTSYAGGRPWIAGKGPTGGKTYVDDFLLEKMSRCSIGWEEAAAKEWIARVGSRMNKDFNSVTLSDVAEYWKGGGSCSIEGHLPYRVPLDYTEHVILTQAAYDSIIADKLGKAVIEHWEKKYGKGFFTITSGRTQDETKNFQMAHPIPESECRTGMTFHVSDESEKPLSIELPSGKFYVTFAAKGKFFAVLATKLKFDEANRNVVTISPTADCVGLSAWHLAPMACMETKKVAKNDSFNLACPYEDYVHYCIAVDHSTGTVTVTHWGPSSAFSNTVLEVKMGQTTDRYRYISFAMGKTSRNENVAIWDLKVTTKEPKRALVPEVYVPPPMVDVTSIKPPGPLLPPASAPMPQNIRPPSPTQRPPGRNLPMCSDPFECPKMNNRRDPEHETHIRQFKHICKFGKGSCREINRRVHNEMFVHLDKPPCPDGPGCQSMNDPAHRLEYHHKDHPDYLKRCRHGIECRDIGNPKHSDEYHHDPNFKFPDTFKYV